MKIDPDWQQMVQDGNLAGFPIILLPETTSTNEVAMDLAEKGAEAYTVVVAEAQTGGRGRLGKKWLSHPGTGLYFSVILQPSLSFEDLPKITLAAGLAVAKAVEGLTDFKIGIKWPNDLILDGCKLGGILCESTKMQVEGRSMVILGVGINVNTPKSAFPEELRDKAISLHNVNGSEHNRGNLLKSILIEIKKQIELFERKGFALILSKWRQRDVTFGRELTWLTQAGEIVKGISMGPDESGQLLIKDRKGKIHDVLSGHISLEKNL